MGCHPKNQSLRATRDHPLALKNHRHLVDGVALRLRLPAEQALCGMALPGARATLSTTASARTQKTSKTPVISLFTL